MLRLGARLGLVYFNERRASVPRRQPVEVLLFAREPLHLGAQQIPRNGPHPRAEGSAGPELIQMPEREDKGVMRQFIHESRHWSLEGKEGADVRQVQVEQRGKSVVVARLRGARQRVLRWRGGRQHRFGIHLPENSATGRRRYRECCSLPARFWLMG